MTLQEKFKKEGFSNYDYLSNVADEFAIGYVIWILSNEDKFVSIEYNTVEEAVKELLEIYKKEKGL
jgi:hypothetical protein